MAEDYIYRNISPLAASGDTTTARPTPAYDPVGSDATTTVSLAGLYPYETEPSDVIEGRTAIIQAEIDAATLAGGGVVYLPSGVYQVNELTLKDRVSIIGDGMWKTVLLASGDIPVGDAVIKSENYDANVTLFDTPTNAPLWRVHGAPQHMAVRELSLIGQGYEYDGAGNVWDYQPSEVNIGRDINGIQLFGHASHIDNVHVTYFSGNGIDLWHGKKTKADYYTPCDTTIEHLGWIATSYITGTGVHIHNFPDGTFEKHVANYCGTGLEIDGHAWHIDNVHAYGCTTGVINNGANYFGTLQAENCEGNGFNNVYTDADQSAGGTSIERLILFANNKSSGDAYANFSAHAKVSFLQLDVAESDKTGVWLSSLKAVGTKLHGECNITVADVTGIILIDCQEQTAGTDTAPGQLDINVHGWFGSNVSNTAIAFRGTSSGSNIVARFGMSASGTSGCHLLHSRYRSGGDVAVGVSNRVKLWYKGFTASEAYYTGVSLNTGADDDTTPEIELIAYT